MAKYSLKVVYPTQTIPTTVVEADDLEEVVSRAREIEKQYEGSSVGFYFERVSED